MTARDANRRPPPGVRARRRRLAVELSQAHLRWRVGAVLAGLFALVLAAACLLDGTAV